MRRIAEAGFTLAEMVAVIVITGIMGAALVVFFRPTVDAYMDVKRRAGLSDMADTALRRIGREVRRAVPNSIRSPNSQCFEMLPTIAGGRVRVAPDTVNDSGPNCSPSASCSAPLDTSGPTTLFDVLSISPAPAPALAGNYVVIGNQNTNDVYAANSSTRALIEESTTPNPLFGPYRLQVASTQFPEGYDGARYSVFAANSGAPAVFYVCSGADGTVDAQGNGKGRLFRVTRALTEAYPTQCPDTANGALVASSIKTCEFIYSPTQGSTQENGFIWMLLELAEGNEAVPLSFGVHVDNVP